MPLFSAIARERGKVAVDDIVSGRGLSALDTFLNHKSRTTQEIVEAARRGIHDALRTVDVFQKLLGRVAGDLALAFDAQGGVFIAGGIARALAPLLTATFRNAFDAHPPHEKQLQRIPVFFVVHPAPELLGGLPIIRKHYSNNSL